MHSKSLRVALMAALAIAGSWPSAHAATAGAATPRAKATPPQRSSHPVDEPDSAPPVLTAFNAAPLVDMSLPGASVVVSIKATDDLSGVQSVVATAIGPNDRPLELTLELNAPSTHLSTKMFTDRGLAFLEPGAYRFVGVRIFDQAFKWRYYDEWELAALGNNTFTLKNNKGFDRTPPTIVSGKVLTPQVSLSADHPGINSGQFAQVTVAVTDAGDSVVAGARSAYAHVCHRSVVNACFTLESDSRGAVPMASKATLKLGAQPRGLGIPAGEYEVKSLWVVDFADNWAGVDTDLGAYFPSTTITLVP